MVVSHFRLAALSASVLLSFSIGKTFAAPVSVISQTRSTHVFVPSNDDGVADKEASATAPDDSRFTSLLSKSQILPDEDANAKAFQNSIFAGIGNTFTANAKGAVSYRSTGNRGIVEADSKFEIQFQVLDSSTYTLIGIGSYINTSSGASEFQVLLTGPDGTIAKLGELPSDPMGDATNLIHHSINMSGTLDPGIYTLSAEAGVSGGGDPTITAGYAFDFIAKDSSTVHPVPLPAAAGQSLILLSGLAAIYFVRGRLQASRLH